MTRRLIICISALLFSITSTAAEPVPAPTPDQWPGAQAGPLEIREAQVQGTEHIVRYGRLPVFENRTTRTGRIIHLDFFIVPALADEPAPDPIFILQGGPGMAAAEGWRRHLDHWFRRQRDIVLVNQRGTGGDNRLACDMSPDDEGPQAHFDPLFTPDRFRPCLEALRQRFDLRQYSTCNAMDDLDDVRRALGYETINLYGGSYGTRAALVYMRRHPEHARTAILNGVAPIAFTNPLYHASEAQAALHRIFEACADDPACAAAFPDLDDEFRMILARLDDEPARVTTTLPGFEGPVTISLDREAFARSLRVYMYYSTWDIPLLIHRAYEGDFEPFVRQAYATSSAIRDALAFGMLLCVTCAEDIDRIDPKSIAKLTKNTFTGDGRVRRQIAVCDIWPRSELPPDYGEPVRAPVPTLIMSGLYDPVTGPHWGDHVASNLPHAVHIILPQAHGVGGWCVDRIMSDLLEAGAVDDLDTACTESVRTPGFSLPAAR
jgi:pimeloyl-ACP methyl ester carboxylesterase